MHLVCAIPEILQIIFQNLNRSRDPEHIMFRHNLSCVHYYSSVSVSLQTKFEMPSFTHFKHMNGSQKFKKCVT